MKKKLFFLNYVIFCLLFLLNGCFHGETFTEWKYQNFSDNPDEFSAVEPNDTQEDPVCKKYLRVISKNLENRGKFKKKVRIIASQNTAAFLNASHGWGNREDKMKALNYFAQKLISGFGTLSDFQIVNTEEEALRGLTNPAADNQNLDIYTLAFNVTILNVAKVWKEESYYSNGNRYTKNVPYCEGSFSASIVLLDNHGVQKMTLDASKDLSFKMEDSGNENNALLSCRKALIDAVSRQLFVQYAKKKAPLAYVAELRGNGLFARIPLGSKYGLRPGMYVDFIQLTEFQDIATGKKSLNRNRIADGVVVRVESTYSWVKINLHHYRKVHLGTLVKIK